MFCLTVASKPSVSGTPKLRFANSTQRSICTHASINKRDLILGAVAASGVTHFATLPAEAGVCLLILKLLNHALYTCSPEVPEQSPNMIMSSGVYLKSITIRTGPSRML